MANEITKRPLKYVEIALNNFTDDAVPYHISLLEKHKHEFQQTQDLSKIKNHQLIIKRTEGKLKDLLNNLDTLRAQVQDSDLHKFDLKTVAVRKSIIGIINEYKEMTKRFTNAANQIQQESEISESTDDSVPEPRQLKLSVNIDEIKIREKEACLENVELIQSEIEDLHTMYGDLHNMVNEQGEMVNQVEANVENAQDNVNLGHQHIVKASRLKTAVYPVAGAAMGGIIGGPVGLLAGLKIGGLTTVVCGCLGYLGGKILNRHKSHENIEQETFPNTTDCITEQIKSNEIAKENKKDE